MTTRLHRAIPLLLATCSVVSAQQPLLSGARPMTGDALIGSAAGDQREAAIAAGDGLLLAAWSDHRADLFLHSQSDESGRDIWLQRLAADGAPLDATAFPAGILPGDDVAPRVTRGADNWLVSWSSQAPGDSPYEASIVGVRVADDGRLLDAAPFDILRAPFTLVTRHAATFDGQQWIVFAGESTSGLPGLCAVRVATNGTLVDPAPVVVAPGLVASGFDCASAQGATLVAWHQSGSSGDDVHGRRWNSALAPLDANPFAIGATALPDTEPRVCSNGSSFLVAWTRASPGTLQGDVQARRVAANGQLLDPLPLSVCGNRPYGPSTTNVAWDGAQWWLAWTYGGIELGRIDAQGVVIDANGFPFQAGAPDTHDEPQLAASPAGGVQLVWADDRQGTNEGLDLRGARVSSPSTQGMDTPLATSAPAQLRARVAAGGTHNLLVAISQTSATRRILAWRLDDAGAPLDGTPIELGAAPAASDPVVAFDGVRYMAAWAATDPVTLAPSVWTRRVAVDGSLLDAAPVRQATGVAPTIAGRSGSFLLAYGRFQAPVFQHPAYVLLNGASGAASQAPVVLSSNHSVQFDACATPSGFVLAWQRNYSVSDMHSDTWAALIDAAGAPGAPIFVAGPFNGFQKSISVACSGAEIMLAWCNGSMANGTRRIDARRLSLAGAALDAAPLRVVQGVAGEQHSPSLTWDGTQYMCLFQDDRGSTSTLDQRSDIYGARIRGDGFVRDPQGFLVERTSASETRPCVAGLGAGRALTASSILRAQPPFGAYRLSLRTFEGDCAPPTTYCSAKLTSLGTLPSIGHQGSSSIAAGDLRLTLSQGVPNTIAMPLRASAPAALPFQNGTLCLQPPLVRAPRVTLDASGAANIAVPLAAEHLGTRRCYQWWSRDVGQPDGTGISLSNGLSFVVCP